MVLNVFPSTIYVPLTCLSIFSHGRLMQRYLIVRNAFDCLLAVSIRYLVNHLHGFCSLGSMARLKASRLRSVPCHDWARSQPSCRTALFSMDEPAETKILHPALGALFMFFGFLVP